MTSVRRSLAISLPIALLLAACADDDPAAPLPDLTGTVELRGELGQRITPVQGVEVRADGPSGERSAVVDPDGSFSL